MATEIMNMTHKIAGLISQARMMCEELESEIRFADQEDDHFEAECYDWASSLEEVERRVEEYMAVYYGEEVDEVNA